MSVAIYQKAFNDINASIAKDAVLANPDYSKNLKSTLMPHLNNWAQ